MVWKKIAEKSEISAGKGKGCKIGGKQIAISSQEGYHGLDDDCVHQEGSISSGKIDGDIVECPLHFWHYNFKTGELKDYIKDVKLQTYPVEIKEDGIYVDF